LILQQLAACGLQPDEHPFWQSARSTHYQQALTALQAAGMAYPCTCSRKDIAQALAAAGSSRPRHGELVYPGTCRQRAAALENPVAGQPGPAWRFRTDLASRCSAPTWHWTDRRLGPQHQQLAAEVGDFVLLRADGLWAYQLAVVVDDAAQGVTHVVRGEDLADNTVRQIALQVALGTVTDAWQLYSGLLFVSMVVWAPGGLSGILLAHAPVARAGRLGRLLPDYARLMPGFVLTLAGVAALSELGFRLEAIRGGASAGRVLGLPIVATEAWPWLVATALFLTGAWLLRRTFPAARAAWQEAAQ
jgi:hypothetical protein